MSDNNNHENKTEVLAEEAKKKELSMENLEQVTGAVTKPGDRKKDYSQKQWKDLLIHILKNK